MSAFVAARLSVTAKASTAPTPSSTRASATEIPNGPSTDAEFDRGRPSLVQIAPAESQFVVAGSVIDTAPEPDGWTWISRRSLRSFTRVARRTVPPVTVNASSRSTRKLTAGIVIVCVSYVCVYRCL